MVFGQRRAERRHRAAKPRLDQGDRVHIAFHDDQRLALAHRLAGDMQIIERATLGKRRRLGAVDIFGLAVAEQPAAKADLAAAPVGDGEHHAAEKHVHRAALALLHQPGFHQLLRLDVLSAQRRRQRAAPLAGPAQAERPDRHVRQAAPAQIVQRRRAFRRPEPVLVNLAGRFQHFGDAGAALLGLRRLRAGFRHLQPGFLGQVSTASMKPAPLVFITKLMTSPCSPQPKQW